MLKLRETPRYTVHKLAEAECWYVKENQTIVAMCANAVYAAAIAHALNVTRALATRARAQCHPNWN